MGTTELVIGLTIAALQHATELQQLLSTATAEGRDVTPAELAALRSKATKAVDALEAAIKAA
jgi:hypothetical protein